MATTTTTQNWTFEVFDTTYKGWKRVVAEGTTKAAAQLTLLTDGYTRVRTPRDA